MVSRSFDLGWCWLVFVDLVGVAGCWLAFVGFGCIGWCWLALVGVVCVGRALEMDLLAEALHVHWARRTASTCCNTQTSNPKILHVLSSLVSLKPQNQSASGPPKSCETQT